MCVIVYATIHGWSVPAVQPATVNGFPNPDYDPLRANYTARLEGPCDAGLDELNSNLVALLVNNGAYPNLKGGCITNSATSDSDSLAGGNTETLAGALLLTCLLSSLATIVCATFAPIMLYYENYRIDNRRASNDYSISSEKSCERVWYDGLVLLTVFSLTATWSCWLVLVLTLGNVGNEGFLCSIRHVDVNTWGIPINPKALNDQDDCLVICSETFSAPEPIDILKQAVNNPQCTALTINVDDDAATYQLCMRYTFAPDAITSIHTTTAMYRQATIIIVGCIAALSIALLAYWFYVEWPYHIGVKMADCCSRSSTWCTRCSNWCDPTRAPLLDDPPKDPAAEAAARTAEAVSRDAVSGTRSYQAVQQYQHYYPQHNVQRGYQPNQRGYQPLDHSPQSY